MTKKHNVEIYECFIYADSAKSVLFLRIMVDDEKLNIKKVLQMEVKLLQCKHK